MTYRLASLLLIAWIAPFAYDVQAEPSTDTWSRVDEALARALPLVQNAARNYPEHKDCFSCHHQTLPMLAMVSLRGANATVDESLLRSQAEFTHGSFHNHLDDLKAGTGIGGRGMTVSYGLWALSLAETAADETTEAMVTYLLKTQEEDGHWRLHSIRPPLEASTMMCAVLVAEGMRKYATEAQKEQVASSIAKARAWLAKAPLESQEDRVARLLDRTRFGATEQEIRDARDVVLSYQRDDGGWSQLETMSSDAYATGQTLWALHESGLGAEHEACQRGIQYLLDTQQADGSWLVETRSKPVQEFFDNGDPHGKHQFISTSATSWATGALGALRPLPAAEPK